MKSLERKRSSPSFFENQIDFCMFVKTVNSKPFSMNNVIVIVILSFLSSQIFAQAKEGDIEMKKSFWGVKFHQDGKPLKPKEVLRIMEANPEAHAEFKKAKSNYDAAQVFGAIGGFMVCWPIGTAIGGGDPQWGLAAGGAGFIL